jgi:hypothetical protein
VTQVESLEFQDLQKYVEGKQFSVRIENLDNTGWSLSNEETNALLNRLRTIGKPLGEYVGGKIYRGVLTGLNEAFVINEEKRRELIASDKKSANLIKPFLAGRDIKRYEQPVYRNYIIFTRRGVDIKKYPAIERHLSAFRDQLEPRPASWKGKEWAGRKPGPYKWYEIQDTVDYYEAFEKPKILFPDISTRGNFLLDESGALYSANTTYFIPFADKYLLGILNSSLMTFFYSRLVTSIRGGYLRFFTQYVEKIPIADPPVTTAEYRNRLIGLVDTMISLNIRLTEVKIEDEMRSVQRRIDAADKQIDALVYELYRLTEEEIRIVEGDQ